MESTADSHLVATEILARCLQLSPEECQTAATDTTAAWDSFAHLEIVVEIEERFGRQLTLVDIESITDLPSLTALIESIRQTGTGS